ncbi:polysaccharide biosynthesis/export family protein [Ancylobacter oerskovii]|uniref:polysaccharide biosynthesis/export family protein n=1 Tax=Ancylobacter oerskovii TaxID=459519 RepID=UPI001BD050F8|nr:polysaccharide biosynthesis/export family protein [Ancylobacter oerskovii]
MLLLLSAGAALATDPPTTPPAAAGTGEYRLGPQDKIRLKVLEWRATRDEIFEWSPMAGEFAVNPEGRLDVPLIGSVEASGRTSAEIGREIGEGLQQLMGLAEIPRVAVEVSEFRPFYAAGDVMRPGPYPYRPKLTVLQAIAIAGGIQRPLDPGLLRLGRDVIAGQGELALLGQERDALRARLGRLQSELDGLEDISFPAEVGKRAEDRAIALLIRQERQIFVGRRDALVAQTNALVQLKSFLEKEAQTLQGQIAAQDKQMALVNQELQAITGLVEKGYAVSSRQLGLERTIAQIQGDKLRLETELLRVRQDASRADISMIDLKNTRTNELTAELRTTQAKLDDTLQKMKTAQQLLYEAGVSAPHRYIERSRALRVEPSYVIVRTSDGEIAEIDATETTPVEPGDTLKVSLPLPEEPEDTVLNGEAAGIEAAANQP